MFLQPVEISLCRCLPNGSLCSLPYLIQIVLIRYCSTSFAGIPGKVLSSFGFLRGLSSVLIGSGVSFYRRMCTVLGIYLFKLLPSDSSERYWYLLLWTFVYLLYLCLPNLPNVLDLTLSTFSLIDVAMWIFSSPVFEIKNSLYSIAGLGRVKSLKSFIRFSEVLNWSTNGPTLSLQIFLASILMQQLTSPVIKMYWLSLLTFKWIFDCDRKNEFLASVSPDESAGAWHYTSLIWI